MNSVFFLWTHPRSMSIAIERVMPVRCNFDCLYDPFIQCLPFYQKLRAHSLTDN